MIQVCPGSKFHGEADMPESLRPLVVKAGTGKISQLDDADKIRKLPRDLTFTYSSNKIATITDGSWVKTFAYSGNKLDTISDTETGKISTFNYTGNNLTSITITNI